MVTKRYKNKAAVYILMVLSCVLLSGCGDKSSQGPDKTAEPVIQGDFHVGGNSLEKNTVVNLGNHIVAYFADPDKLPKSYQEHQYLAIQDLEEGSITYIPMVEGTILDISAADDFHLYIKYKDEMNHVQEMMLPICLANGKNVEKVRLVKEKVVAALPIADYTLPEKVWDHIISMDGKNYEVVFERIGILYDGIGEFDFLADYRLTVKEENGNIIQELIFVNYPVWYEEVCWIEDIGKDGGFDIIFCTDTPVRTKTKMLFLIWNKKRQQYVRQELPEEYVDYAMWHKELGMVLLPTKIYTVCNGRLEIYAEVIEEEQPEHCFRVIFYEDGKIVQENVSKEKPWWNSDNIFYRGNIDNYPLYPDVGWEWEYEQLLDTGGMVHKLKKTEH